MHMADSMVVTILQQKGIEGIQEIFHEHELCNVIVQPDEIRRVMQFLKGDPDLKFNMLIDIVAIDYSAYPHGKQARFGIVYHLKSLAHNMRLAVRAFLDEARPQIDSIHDLYNNADWLERECWDQMGIRFLGHPNLKRLLNHKDFIGHPLRKDYPIDRRQWLEEPDDLMDEMERKLLEKGIRLAVRNERE